MKLETRWFFVVLGFLIGFPGYGQSGEISISGVVVEAQSKRPIEYATVVVGDTLSGKILKGTTTGLDGIFNLATGRSDIYIEVSYVGFQTFYTNQLLVVNGRVHLDTISLQVDGKSLDQLTIYREKSSVEFKLDKRVFNVGKDLSNSGASAVDVLNNVPSVNVNIEGEISLRGSQGAQVLINGKPSVLSSDGANALGTLTAEEIDRVEVITNPSAKYDAEGTAGIINIVLKKNKKSGTSGSVTLNGGIPNNHSLGLSINRRTSKFNVFSQLGAGYRTRPEISEQTSQDLVRNTYLFRDGEGEKNEGFFYFVLGADYHIDSTSVMTLSGRYAFEWESESSLYDFSFEQESIEDQRWLRSESTTAGNPKWEYDLQYKKDFKNHEDHDLLMSATGRFFGKEQSSSFEEENVYGEHDLFIQQTETDFSEGQYAFKLDYVRPFKKKYTLETGGQYLINNVSNDYTVSNLENEAYVVDASLSNVFDYFQGVVGVYALTAYEGTRWGVKTGLRYENTQINTVLKNTSEENQNNYGNFFPTIHTSYNVSKKFSLQAGYSRRIYRPRLWDLNPFVRIRDNYNISSGNPDLQPEFTDSYEANGIWKLNKVSLNTGIYYRQTKDIIERIQTFEDNVSWRRPFNVGTSQTVGLEANVKYSPRKWFTLLADMNYNGFAREGQFENQNFDFTGDRWMSKLTTKWKLPAQTDLEVSGNYESRMKTVQGEELSNYFANVGVRKKISNGKIIFNMSVRDVFATRRRAYTTTQPDFYLSGNSRRGRFIVLGVSYGFGKGEAMEFSGSKRF